MINHNYYNFLGSLSPQDFGREVKQTVTDSLHELVACIKRSLRRERTTLHACVIDDFQVRRIVLGDHDCRVRVHFRASARHGIGAVKELERVTGYGEAIIDEVGRLRYQNVVFAGERDFIAHDLGGSD
jgi:hypothetical protein